MGDLLVEADSTQKQSAFLDLIPLGQVDPLVLSIAGANIQAVLDLPTKQRMVLNRQATEKFP